MKQYILMADIIDSRIKDELTLLATFKKMIQFMNKKYRKSLLSPLTITLGDEFQGIVKNLATANQLILEIEEYLIHEQVDFKLRFILNFGEIMTPVNPKIAYEMLGKGLVDARVALSRLKNVKHRFCFILDNAKQEEMINMSYIILQNIIDKWQLNDLIYVSSFITYDDYKMVAEKLKKSRSQIWKREKTLNMESYQAIKKIIYLLSQLSETFLK